MTCFLVKYPGGVRSLGCYGLTPILTPTPVNSGERPRTLGRQNGRFPAPSCTLLNVAERTSAGSKTAGCRFDACPTCPLNPGIVSNTRAGVLRCPPERPPLAEKHHRKAVPWRPALACASVSPSSRRLRISRAERPRTRVFCSEGQGRRGPTLSKRSLRRRVGSAPTAPPTLISAYQTPAALTARLPPVW